MKSDWTKKEVAEALGIKQSTIAYYADQGLITPAVANPKGKGTRRRYSKRNLLEILIIRELVQLGAKLAHIKQAMKLMNLDDDREFWDLEARKVLVNPQGIAIRWCLVGFDLNTPEGSFGKIKYHDGAPVHVNLSINRHTSAVVVDVTNIREKVQKLL